jgi:hypothetical protein
MAVKSVYVKDEDVHIWDKAKDLAGESLSQLLTSYIKQLVITKESANLGKERIVLHYKEDIGIPVAKSFYGKWIIDPSNALQETESYGIDNYAVASTQKNNIVVFNFLSNGEKQPNEEGKFGLGVLYVFNNVDELKNASPLPIWVIGTIIEKMDLVEIEELDI